MNVPDASRVAGSTSAVAEIRAVLRTRGPLSRRGLAETTGYSRVTLSAAVAELVALDEIDEIVDPAGRTGRGRPSRLLRSNPRRADRIGVEIGRAHIAVAAADATGEVVVSAEESAPPTSSLLERARAAVRLAVASAAAVGVSLEHVRQVAAGTPGPRVRNPGIGLDAIRLAEGRAAVRTLLEEGFGAPVEMGNNTTLMALTESTARASRDLVFLRLDEGVGGGVVLDGMLTTGGLGAAGELGHMSVDPAGDRCPCGGRGCLELIASMPALVRGAAEADAGGLAAAVAAGRHGELVDDAARATGWVLAGAVALANPRVVVLAGAVAALPGFFDTVELTIRDLAPAWATGDLVIEPVQQDSLAGALGALVLAGAPRGARLRPLPAS